MKKCIIIALAFLMSCTQERADITTLSITNKDSADVVVWLTLGGVAPSDTSLWVQNVNGIFGITQNGLVGSFILAHGQTLHYTPIKAIQGQFCFNGQAYQRLSDSIYTGSTLTEFCLNNYGTVENAQETIDISCVAGISYIAAMDMCGGGIWTANFPGHDTVYHIQNDIFGRNTNKVGVFPVACDNCTQSSNPPTCVKGKGETPSTNAICQVQRNAKNSGGCVTVTYISKPYQICNK